MNDNIKTETYWNGLPAPAERGSVLVADTSQFPDHWTRRENVIGTRIPVVRVVLVGVHYGTRVIYLDNRKNAGWIKVTDFLGSPKYGHKTVPVVVDSFEATP